LSLRGLSEIINDKDHPQRLSAIKEVLARNDLYALGVEPKAPFNPAQRVNVDTQVNVVPELHVENMSDQELATYDKLLEELRELLPKD
jgi:ABC-type Zn uptake system ZnuABC Zn-binding protein ZnuA